VEFNKGSGGGQLRPAPDRARTGWKDPRRGSGGRGPQASIARRPIPGIVNIPMAMWAGDCLNRLISNKANFGT